MTRFCLLLALVALAVADESADIEAELLKEGQEGDERVPIHHDYKDEHNDKHLHKVKLPKTASYKNEDDDIPDVETLQEDSRPNKVRFEDDIILEKRKDAKLWMLLRLPGYKDIHMTKISSSQASVRAIVTGPVNTLWPNAVVPFYIDKSRRRDTTRILSAIRHLEKRTCIRFPRLKRSVFGRNYVRVVKGSWASSRLGIDPQHIPQNINLHDGFLKGNLIHEFMHALGFLHEHSRPDRSKYLLMSSRIKRRWNFRRADLRGLEWESMGIPYDYKSITHYSAMNMTPRDPRARRLMGQRYALTEKDICQLNRMYKCYQKLDEMDINCDCLDSYTEGTCKWLMHRGMCKKKKKILDLICPKTCGICCQSKCEVDFHKVGCFNDHGIPVNKKARGSPYGIFFDNKGVCLPKAMKKLDKNLCKCAKKTKKKGYKYFTITKDGLCVGKKTQNFVELRESEYCRNTKCKKVQFSNVECAQGGQQSIFMYKLKKQTQH